MLKISILKVDSPSCLWGRVVQGPGRHAETTQLYDSLLSKMNLFYHDVTQDLRWLKPLLLEEGQVCVVYWAVMKSWCRAVVESVIMDSISCQVRCLLVDHGEQIVIPSDHIREAMPDFLQLPFLVRKFHLAGVKPTTLKVSVYEKRAELIPSSQWDSSATLYLHSLLQASTQTEAVLLESESDSTSIQLYLTVRDIKICVNDDLVAKTFAYYRGKSADDVSLDAGDRTPVMFNILTQAVSISPKKLTAQPRQPPVTSQNFGPAEAGDSLTTSLPQLQVVWEEKGREVTEEQVSSGTQSRNGSEGAADSDLLEDTDSSLAVTMTKNLNHFRFLKFLNHASIYHRAAPDVGQKDELNEPKEITTISSVTEREQDASSASSETQLRPSYISDPQTSDLLQVSCLKSEAADAPHSSRVEHPEDGEMNILCTESLDKSKLKPPERGDMWKSEEGWACSRLLEWLNPDPLNPDPDDVVSSSDPCMNRILVHSALPVDPCTSLEDAPITDTLRWVLQRKQYCVLSPADHYSWPAVARGCNTVIVSNNANQPLSYLPPLLTHIQLNSIFTSLTSSSGPIAVLLCPGWERVQAVYEVLEESKVCQTLHPAVVQLGVGKDESKDVKIPKNCLLLVTTPFSLVRVLSHHCFLFLRLYHLLLDEAEQLFTVAPDQMATILMHFQKVASNEEKALYPKQVVAATKRWSSHMEDLITSHMPYPCIVMTVPEEAAFYGNVQQTILMTLESSKISILLGVLDFSPDISQKTLIVANSVQEVEDVFQAVKNKSAFCLKTHEGLTDQFDFVIQQWRKNIGAGTHVILVTTNECLKCLGIRDATCVVHFGFPTSPKLFGSRLFCMAQHFRNLSQQHQKESCCSRVTRSILLISERNAQHVFGVLRYLRRTNAVLPPELLTFAEGVHEAREDQKKNLPLCSYLKSFGFCRDSSLCPDRHQFNPQLDQSLLPASGVIEVVPLYIKTASVFYGRLVRKEDMRFDMMASEMVDYYADKKPGAKELLEGSLYAVQEDKFFHRVKILSLPDRSDSLFFNVLVRFIDVGKEENVKSHQFLQLPEQFHSLPGQAVEIILCRVKPVDAETNWHPKVIRKISQKIQGVQHRARVVLCLGNTVFVDPMVRVTQVPGMKTLINEYNVQSEILSTGMGVSNPEHVDLLRALCKDGQASSREDPALKSGRDGLSCSEVRMKAVDKVQADTFRAAEEPAAPPVHNVSGYQQTQMDQQNDINPPEQMDRTCNCFNDGRKPCKTVPEGDDHPSREKVTDNDLTNSFHPQVRWYQTSDYVVVTVKLMNPDSQRCDFYPDRVIYSGRVNCRTYRAVLDLHQNIAADCCRWEMKSNEPVLKLVKQHKEYWDRLTRTKNIFVSYDMEHFEDEDEAADGRWFVENTGEDDQYVNSESCSDSD
ncbi:putative ATP-dependent RNA helicase TDRD12 isoform X2 [Melanotaenia boesemani]|uniref:putative ATP-dependent RNA helicase TDRD12 isoform X2 n=1 Tax=Melanotaenia boesemani TaxID=1250792 RepID=UPI001C05A740|nr:putative ATP-dependent RNA helicase TDRD12 isoform X2 [Melanotaenia boesemani]